MASKNNNPSRTAANLLLSPVGLQQILRLQSLEDRGRIITAAAEYFLSDYRQEPQVEGTLCEFVFIGIKEDIDRNEQHCAKTREKNRDGGRTTQQRRREAINAKRGKEALPDCTVSNLYDYAIEIGLDDDTAKEKVKAFWDYNVQSGYGNVRETDIGDLKLIADAKGNPLYNWKNAFIGHINKQYNRQEWEEENEIDPKTHKPRQI